MEELKKKRQLVGIACAHSETEGKSMMRCLLMEELKKKRRRWELPVPEVKRRVKP